MGWTGVTTLQRKRRCHLQESKSGLYYIDTLMESGGWMLKDRPTDTHRPMMTKKTPEKPFVHRNSNAPSRQSFTTDAVSEQRQDIGPCACFPPEFIRHRIRNLADAKTVYEDPYSAECGTEVLKEIPQRLKGGGIKPVKDGSTAFERDRTLSSTEALKYVVRICTDGICRYQTTCIRQGQESAKCRIGFDSTPVDGKRRM